MSKQFSIDSLSFIIFLGLQMIVNNFSSFILDWMDYD